MISQLNSANIKSALGNTIGEPKESKKAEANAQLTKQNRVEQLKASIESGEYKIDLQALSEKMAQELL